MMNVEAAGPLRRLLMVTGGLAISTTAGAQVPPQAAPQEPLPFEVAAFGGYTFGGGFKVQDLDGTSTNQSLANQGTFAAAFDYRLEDTRQYEIFYSRESSNFGGNTTFPRTRMTVQYIHAGGTVLLDDLPGFSPYIAGGLGATLLDPGMQGNSDTKLSMSLALGLRWTLNQRFAVRVEGRGFATWESTETSLFCRSDQSGAVCQVQSRSSGFFQGQVLAGVVFAF
jgi:opacity protein-like surface antigen